MSVEIDPVELGFHRPFTTEVAQTLKIRNPGQTSVAFKVKTTAPKQYCVRPNSGRIEPGQQVEVSVLLQAMKVEPPLDAKCRDKFLVQSVLVPADKEFDNVNAVWQSVDTADKSSVQEKKIRVTFLPPVGSEGHLTPQRNGVSSTPENEGTPSTAPPAYRSPSPDETTYTPATRSNTGTVLPGGRGNANSIDDTPSGNKHLGEAKASAHNPAVSPSNSMRESVKSATSRVAEATPTTMEELKEQLREAQAALAAATQEGGLRLRKAREQAQEKVVQMQQQGAVSQGVPVQWTAALCLLSFLLAYLLF